MCFRIRDTARASLSISCKLCGVAGNVPLRGWWCGVGLTLSQWELQNIFAAKSCKSTVETHELSGLLTTPGQRAIFFLHPTYRNPWSTREELRRVGVVAPQEAAGHTEVVQEAEAAQEAEVAAEDKDGDEEEDAEVTGLIPLVFTMLSTYGAHLKLGLELTSSSESGSEGGKEPASDEELGLSDDVESADEDEQSNLVKPYHALLQGLSESSAPSAKRRKLNDGEKQSYVEEPASDEPDLEEDRDIDEAEDEETAETADEIPEAPLDDDEEDASDPFDLHFANPDDTSTSKKVAAVQGNRWTTKRSVTKRSRVVSMLPEGSDESQASAPESVAGPDSLKLKQRLKPGASSALPKFDDVQRDLAPMLFDYRDIFYCQRTVQNSDALRKLTCLHALNHVFK